MTILLDLPSEKANTHCAYAVLSSKPAAHVCVHCEGVHCEGVNCEGVDHEGAHCEGGEALGVGVFMEVYGHGGVWSWRYVCMYKLCACKRYIQSVLVWGFCVHTEHLVEPIMAQLFQKPLDVRTWQPMHGIEAQAGVLHHNSCTQLCGHLVCVHAAEKHGDEIGARRDGMRGKTSRDSAMHTYTSIYTTSIHTCSAARRHFCFAMSSGSPCDCINGMLLMLYKRCS